MSLLDEMYHATAEIKAAFYRAEEERNTTGVISDETAAFIDRANRNRTQVVTELGSWFISTEAKLAALKVEYEPILEKIKSDYSELEDRLDFIKRCIQTVLPPEATSQVVNESVYVHYKRSERVQVDNPDGLPIEYQIVVTRPDLEKLKLAISNGEDVEGVRIAENWSPQIKIGGLKAIKNGEARLKRLTKGEE